MFGVGQLGNLGLVGGLQPWSPPLAGGANPAIYADFTAGNYFYNNAIYSTYAAWAAAVGGTFTRASNATFVNSSGFLTQASSGVLRFDYDPVTLAPKGILIEGNSSNLLLQSNAFTTTWTTTNANLTSAATTSPDGTVDGWKLTEPGTTVQQHSVQQLAGKAGAATILTYTKYAKQAERTRIMLQMYTGAVANGAQATFDLAGGQIGVPAALFGSGWTAASASITNAGNGWWRCVLQATSDATTQFNAATYLDAGSGTGAANNSYAGTAGFGVYIFGAQTEPTIGFAGSYMPTTTGTVSRAADVWTSTTSGVINNPAGSLFGYASSFNPNPQTGVFAALWDPTDTTGEQALIFQGPNLVRADVYASAYQLNVNRTIWVINTSFKDMSSYQSGNMAAAVNGVVAGTSVSTVLPTGMNSFSLGSINSTQQLWGWVRQVGYWPIFVSQSELMRLTT